MSKTNCLLKEARIPPKDCNEGDCVHCGWNKDEAQRRKAMLEGGGLRCTLWLKKRSAKNETKTFD